MGVTWDLDPDGFLLRVFFFNGGCVLAKRSPPPSSRVIPYPPLVTTVLIKTKGAESLDSSRIGVIGALVFLSV